MKLFRNESKNLFFGNRVISVNIILSLIFNIAIWAGLYLQIEPRVEPVALRYSIYFGIDLIGPWWHVFIFPLMGLTILAFNLIIAYLVFLKVKLLSYFLIISNTIVQILLMIMSVLVVLLNK